MDPLGFDIGIKDRNLVLKTANKIYVKVQDKYYEIAYREQESEEKKNESIVKIDNIETEEYPGDNKLVITPNGLYFTENESYTSITQKQEEHIETSQVNNVVYSSPTTIVNEYYSLYRELSENIFCVIKEISNISAKLWISDGIGEFNNETFIDLFINSERCKNIAYSPFVDSDEWYRSQDEYRLDFWNNFFFYDGFIKSTDELRSESLSYRGHDLYYFENGVNKGQCHIEDFEDIIHGIVDTSNWEMDAPPQDYINKTEYFDGSYYKIQLKSNSDNVFYVPFTVLTIFGKDCIITKIEDWDTIIVKLKNEDDILNSNEISGNIDYNLPVIHTGDKGSLDLYNGNNLSLRIGNLSDIQDQVWSVSGTDHTVANPTVGVYSDSGIFINPTIKSKDFEICPDLNYTRFGGLTINNSGEFEGELINRINELEETVNNLLERIAVLENKTN